MTFRGCPPTTRAGSSGLLDRIVRREGIGDVLANGTHWAAEEIGKGAHEYAHNNIKKHEQLPLKLGMLNPIYFLMYSTGEKINITQIEGNYPQAPFATREEREEFCKDWVQVPDEKFKEYFLNWELRGEKSIPHYPGIEATCEIVNWQEQMHYIDDATGMCAGLSSFPLKPPYHIHNLPTFISNATGMELDEEGLTQIAKRIRNLVRAVNIRRGMRRKDEKPPADHWRKRFPELEEELLNAYYTIQGVERGGHPDRGVAARALPGLRGRRFSPAGHLAGRGIRALRGELERGKCIVKVEKKKKIVKTIKIDVDKCNGCRACEVICSSFHATPKYSSNNPERARIRVIHYPLQRSLRSGLRGRVRRGRMRGQRQVHDRRQGVRRVRLLQGLLPVPGRLQRTRLRSPSEVRHV